MYWYKKKYAMVDDKHKIYNFRLKKIHTDKITKRRIKNYGSITKFIQIQRYMHRKYYAFCIGTKHEKKYI